MKTIDAMFYIGVCKLSKRPTHENIKVFLQKIDHLIQYYRLDQVELYSRLEQHFAVVMVADRSKYMDYDYVPGSLTEDEIDIMDRLIETGCEAYKESEVLSKYIPIMDTVAMMIESRSDNFTPFITKIDDPVEIQYAFKRRFDFANQKFIDIPQDIEKTFFVRNSSPRN
jgi:hypothetical protein